MSSDDRGAQWIAAPPPPPPEPGTSTQAPPTRSAHQSGRGGQQRRAGLGEPAAKLAGAAKDFAGELARDLGGRSPWTVGAAAIVLAFAGSWFSSALGTFRHAHGLTGQARLLQLFGDGSAVWALAILVGIALAAAGKRFEMSRPADVLDDVVLLALLGASVAIALSAAIDVLVELSNLGMGIDAALSGLVGYIAVLPLAVAAAWWARQLGRRTR